MVCTNRGQSLLEMKLFPMYASSSSGVLVRIVLHDGGLKSNPNAVAGRTTAGFFITVATGGSFFCKTLCRSSDADAEENGDIKDCRKDNGADDDTPVSISSTTTTRTNDTTDSIGVRVSFVRDIVCKLIEILMVLSQVIGLGA
jgi:hypothetical protein